MNVNSNPTTYQQAKSSCFNNNFSIYHVSTTPDDQPLLLNISANYRKNSKLPEWDTQGPRGKLVHEKSLKTKILCHTPFSPGYWHKETRFSLRQ
jgi:hypothetical protein